MKCTKCGAENDEGYKFCGTCGTPLVIPVAPIPSVPKTPERESVTYPAVMGHTKLLKLNCPSCGGALELPDNLTIAHCMYCGGKILLDQDGVVQERRDLTRYSELCKVAVEAQNHKEVIEYCNQILEIDPKNVEAWINKAVSTFWLTTGVNDRFGEAMEYLDRASDIAPDDAGISVARTLLIKQEAQWLNHLGNQQWETATRIHNIYTSGMYGSNDRARQNSHDHVLKAMN